MKKSRSTKIISAALAVIVSLSAVSVNCCADFEEKGGKTYYTDESGEYVKGFVEIDDETYYFDSKGIMKTGWLKLKNGDKYYFDKDGKMVTGFETIDEEKYYFASDGKMKTGWLETKKGSTYYFSEKDGHDLTGLYTIGNKKYYFNDSGKMHKGWKKIKGNSYYFDDLGEMVTSQTLEISGKTYKFDKNGVAKASTGKKVTEDTDENNDSDKGKVNSKIQKSTVGIDDFGKSSKTVLKKSGFADYYIAKDGLITAYYGRTIWGSDEAIMFLSFYSGKLYNIGFCVDASYSDFISLRKDYTDKFGYDYTYEDGLYLWLIGDYYISIYYDFDNDCIYINFSDYSYYEFD